MEATTLGNVFGFFNGKSITPGSEGEFPAYGSNGLIGCAPEALYSEGLVIGRVGAYCGSVALARTPFWPSDNTIVAVPNAGQLDLRFAFYLLTNMDLHRWAGGAAQPLLTQTALRQVQTSIPAYDVQRRIADVLSAYDDLIENNTKRIKILEEMARSLYREWFVEFRFPGHENVKFVESEIGRVPKGWTLVPIGSLIERVPNQRTFRDEDVQSEGVIPVIDQSRAEILGFHDGEPDHVATELLPLAIFGDHTCKLQLLVVSFSTGPNVVVFRSTSLPIHYVYAAMSGTIETQEYKRHWSVLTKKTVLAPTRDLADKFSGLVIPFLKMESKLRDKNRQLRRTRDLLLPRLISGEIELPP